MSEDLFLFSMIGVQPAIPGRYSVRCGSNSDRSARAVVLRHSHVLRDCLSVAVEDNLGSGLDVDDIPVRRMGGESTSERDGSASFSWSSCSANIDIETQCTKRLLAPRP